VKRSLVVKLTQGAEAPETANQAFTVAATALAAGVGVSMWLTGEGAWFALPDGAGDLKLPHATPLADLRATILAGGTLTVCSQCAVRRGITEDDVLDGVRIAGSASFVEEVLLDDAQALVY
jgi:predicted peroxiredoxin